jgi:hypothetical protein
MNEKLSGSEFDMAFVPISLDDLDTVVERNVCWLTTHKGWVIHPLPV